MDDVKLEQRHGKARVRVGRVWRDSKTGTHHFAEWNVSISLLSDCLPAYTHADNSNIVATDTMKNTVYVKAKECKHLLSMEDFAIVLGRHFTSSYQQDFDMGEIAAADLFGPTMGFHQYMVSAAIINIVEKPWERIYIGGQQHEHGFKLGSEKHTTEVTVNKSGALEVISGIAGLALLKTTQSGFEGFVRDNYTILPETRERMLATEVTATWRYPFETLTSIPAKQFYFTETYMEVKKVLVNTFFGPAKGGVYSPSVQSTLYQMGKAVLARVPDVSSIQLRMPNIHFLPVNLSSKHKLIVKFEDDVYLPTDEPHGSIEATLSRIRSKM